jgi:polyhydroxyalkanoate synthesis regulator protein
MQMLVPRYLEVSMQSFAREQEKFREQMTQAFGAGPFAPLEDQVRRNMEMFERAFAMFAPFARREAQAGESQKTENQKGESQKPAGPSGGEIDDLKRQLDDVQKRLDRLSETKS